MTSRSADGDLQPTHFDLDGIEEWHIAALSVFLADVARHSDLSIFGRYLLHDEVATALDTLRRSRELKPAAPATVACIIAGRPRTGTTLLHNLLALHPGLRGLGASEAVAPLHPERGMDRVRHRRRVAERLSPSLFELHRPATDTVEESNVLTAATFVSWQWAVPFHTPDYADWLRKQDMSPVHHWEQRVLSHLDRSRPWIIKSPFFCASYGAVRRMWPHALIVCIERATEKSEASWNRLVEGARAIYSNRPIMDSSRWQRLFSELASPPPPMIQVGYEELVRDPMAVCIKVLALLGLDPGASEYAVDVDRFLREDSLRV